MLIMVLTAACLALGACSSTGGRPVPAGPSTSASTTSAPGPTESNPTGPNVPADGDVYLGVSTDIGRLDAFDRAAGLAAGRNPAIYDQWTTPNGPVQPTLDNARTRPGMTPMISWNLPLADNRISDGSQDAYIRAQADAIRAYGGPVFLRLDWEMNASWYTGWNMPGVSPAQFVAAWRHVYAVFRQQGATNAAFVWCPTLWNGPGGRSASDWYPGDAYVGWLGIDAYPQSAVAPFILNGPGGLNDTAAFAVAHDKPLMVAEWAPALPAPDTTAAMDLIFQFAAAHPDTVKALVYFDFVTDGKDYTLADHPVGAADFRRRVDGDPHFLLSTG